MRIETHEVTAGYGRRDVLRELSFTCADGELVGVIGPNGSGKTTLLRVLTGYLAPRRGQTLLDGRPAHLLLRKEVARMVAFVPQSEPAVFDFTVREVVLMG